MNKEHEVTTFAGGCFWCTEEAFRRLPGVTKVTAGYIGGKTAHSYEKVCSSRTGYREAILVEYEPALISYQKLVEFFWQQIDPTDAGGQFADRGTQYKTAIYYHTLEQKKIAKHSKKKLQQSGKFKSPIVTEIIPYKNFYPAEEYHQDFARKCPLRYQAYKLASGRKEFQKEM